MDVMKQIQHVPSHFKLALAVFLSGLVAGCATVYDQNAPNRSNLSYIHSSKDIAITFPAWISEGDKYSELEKSARLKATQKCLGGPYKLIDLKSDPYVFGLLGGRASVISANISCPVLETPDAVQGNRDQHEAELVAANKRKQELEEQLRIKQEKHEAELVAAKKREKELEEQLRIKQSGTSAPALGDRIRLIESSGTFKVPVRLNEQINLNFTIDSGASDVTIPADVVMTLIRTGTIKNSDFRGEQTYVLADGSKIKSKTFILRTIQVGNRTLRNVQASLVEINASLLLGQSFLKRFKSWSIDNATHELVLE